MRSKAKARKITNDEAVDEHSFGQAPSIAAPIDDVMDDHHGSDDSIDTHHDNTNNTAENNNDATKTITTEHPPVYIPEDIPIPDQFELRESTVIFSLGVWTKFPISAGQKFGPFQGQFKAKVDDPSAAWECGYQWHLVSVLVSKDNDALG
ncbi:unnamed protein product [Owenia fusiformis]|uniref:Uncharacterized protein n=1 Tax=Owenia fusiformis TaxID=6347 RepID=A0A8S4N236_OWEFU|nr:unnamed protein product [Owenia fusiformis]